MPNRCRNTLRISGRGLWRFKSLFLGDECVYPENVVSPDPGEEAQDAMHMVLVETLVDEPECLDVVLDTAWSPPI